MKELKLFDEQKIKKMKKAVAAGAVFMTLGCGVAQAMPTGGQVVEGCVQVSDRNGTVDYNVPVPGATSETRIVIDPKESSALVHDATIATVGGPAIVDWSGFDVLDKRPGGSSFYESLTINTTQGAILNRVNDNQVNITGSLRQVGGYPCWIVSTAGIVINNQNGTEISGSKLNLSTIELSVDDFMAMANNEKVIGGIIVEAGNGGKISLPNGVTAYTGRVTDEQGKEIEIAPGVAITLAAGGASFGSLVEAPAIDTELPEPVQEAAVSVTNVLVAATETVNGPNAGPAAVEGNGQPGAVAPVANEPGSMGGMATELSSGIGKVENGVFSLGTAEGNANEAPFVGVGTDSGFVMEQFAESDADTNQKQNG